ncbi:MAG: alpha-glucosidase/alpha-galactosidase [bacterium]
MPKVAIIGAGSLVFARRLMIDILSFPALRETTFALVDIDQKRLDYARRVAERTLAQGKFSAKIEATTDRKQALPGCDYVIISILTGGFEAIEHDVKIPLKYGVDQCISDTIGPGGVFRALRTIPVILDICRDIERLCPDAWVLQYTNPMAMLCWAAFRETKVKLVGLCHSVQGTAWQWATRIGAVAKNTPVGEVGPDISYHCAGINHQAWFLKFLWRGKDAYPAIREAARRPDVYGEDTVRCEMLKHLGYCVTESSGHNSEYNPWFRKRPDLVAKFCPGGSWNGGSGFILQLYGSDRAQWETEMERLASGKDPIDFTRSHEYGSHIINAIETSEPYHFNGNVKNDGWIENLSPDCCVEVPIVADGRGLHPSKVGSLPSHLAALNLTNINVQRLAVEAAIETDRRKAFWAIAHDPLTGAVCTLDEIQSMTDDLFQAEAKWLPQFSK